MSMKPSGATIYYPRCGKWDCDDDWDWEWIGPKDRDYSAVKREHQIATYHEPRDEWRSRLQIERDKRNHGDPLWINLR